MKVYILFALGIFVNYSQSPTAMPLKKVQFPKEDSDDNDDNFSYINVEPFSTTSDNFESKLMPKLQFRIDATTVPCSNQTIRFCEQIGENQYPMQHIKTVLMENAERYSSFFNNINVRDDFPEPINLCDTYTRKIYPQIAMNIDSDWRFIINQPEHRQSIRVQLCQKRSSQCQFGEFFPAGYVSSCTQKFTKIPLLSLDENGELKQFDYEFPSHCQCDLRKVR